MKTAIYCRVSTDKQEVDNQLNQLRPYCKAVGWEITREYTDVISGKELSRPAYDQMFLDAHKRLFDVVIFWDLSRFSRAGTLHTLQKLHELELLGIGYKSFQEPYLDSVGQFKDVIIAIFASVAKIERMKISERTKAGLIGKKNVGKRGKDKKVRRNRGYIDRQQRIKNMPVSPLVSSNVNHYDTKAVPMGAFCRTCGESDNSRLVLHHVTPSVNGGSDNIANIVTLCDDCHKSIHNGVKKDLTTSQLTKIGMAKTPNRDKIGKRGKDKTPRKSRSDKGEKRQYPRGV